MVKAEISKAVCQICGKKNHSILKRALMIRPDVMELIRKEKPDFSENGWICADDLDRFIQEYVRSLIIEEKGELTAIEEEVIRSIREQELVSDNIDAQYQDSLTIGQKLADKMADFGGSWKFIIIFSIVIFLWLGLNSYLLFSRPFDPFPFILLNLVLSCIAAIQAPVIMMSQKRQESRDRMRSVNDYQINLKAELEIRHLHQKIDHILSKQWDRLIEIQEIQLEIMEELRDKKK
jgi:uncharacterized membrane protein